MKIVPYICLFCLLLASIACEKEAVVIPKAKTAGHYSIQSAFIEYENAFLLPKERMRNIKLDLIYNFQSGFNRILQGEMNGEFATYLNGYINGAEGSPIAKFQYNPSSPGVWTSGNYSFIMQDSVLTFSTTGEDTLLDFPFSFGLFKPGEPLSMSLTLTHNGFQTAEYRAKLVEAKFTQDVTNPNIYTKSMNGKKYSITIDNATIICLIQ